jgi:hypothetical protein
MSKSYVWASRFNVGDRVHIDKDQSIKATVISIQFHHDKVLPLYELGWICNGDSKVGAVREDRLTAVTE